MINFGSSSGGAVAQLGARLDGIEEVVGSNPIGSTNLLVSGPETWALHNVPKTWVTLLGRKGFRVVRALASPDRNIQDHNP